MPVELALSSFPGFIFRAPPAKLRRNFTRTIFFRQCRCCRSRAKGWLTRKLTPSFTPEGLCKSNEIHDEFSVVPVRRIAMSESARISTSRIVCRAYTVYIYRRTLYRLVSADDAHSIHSCNSLGDYSPRRVNERSFDSRQTTRQTIALISSRCHWQKGN